jgi:predicted O-methyltransferase YrrM
MLSVALAGRPRILNALHALGIAEPFSQTTATELACLGKHAQGRKTALEIGSFQGVSASVIARSMDPGGRLYCIDPWDPVGTRENAVLTIAKRHFRRTGVETRITLLQGLSTAMARLIPESVDFAFIDGDHTYEGLSTDWAIVAPRVVPGGLVCLHDTAIPATGWPTHAATRYFEEAIRRDARFRLIETVHSLNVLERHAT